MYVCVAACHRQPLSFCDLNLSALEWKNASKRTNRQLLNSIWVWIRFLAEFLKCLKNSQKWVKNRLILFCGKFLWAYMYFLQIHNVFVKLFLKTHLFKYLEKTLEKWEDSENIWKNAFFCQVRIEGCHSTAKSSSFFLVTAKD